MNENLAYGRNFQSLTIDGDSDTVTLPAGLQAVTLVSDTALYFVVGEPGGTPTASSPSAEKTVTDGQYLPADIPMDFAIPVGSENSKVKIAAVQASAGGTLYVNYRSFV